MAENTKASWPENYGKNESSEVDETLTIPAGYFVHRVDLDSDPPTCNTCRIDSFRIEDEETLVVPKALAYYLSTHSCGSKKFRALVDNMAAQNERAEIAELFEKLMEKLGFKIDFDKVLELVKKTVEEEEE
ncbi:hypothetical protein HN803_04420 [candidate division WWE3 bacterium]|jgi:hypothetical protein|nr:hypothetical protein [Candidatus Scalindua sp.]MBT7350009.1 hypothetical protein [candidate division WWE3 bacterium]